MVILHRQLPWLYCRLDWSGEEGWLPFWAVQLNRRTDRISLGSYRVSGTFRSLGPGYLTLVTGDPVQVNYQGSEQTGDPGWLFGCRDCDHGWFPVSAIRPMMSLQEQPGRAQMRDSSSLCSALPATDQSISRIRLKFKRNAAVVTDPELFHKLPEFARNFDDYFVARQFWENPWLD